MNRIHLIALIFPFLLFSAFVPRIHHSGRKVVAPDFVPSGLSISSPRPNPFRTYTELTLNSSNTQLIAVEVVNLTGQRKAFLFEGMLQADEAKTVRFEANDLPSGVYFFLIRGESLVTTRKIVLAR